MAPQLMRDAARLPANSPLRQDSGLRGPPARGADAVVSLRYTVGGTILPRVGPATAECRQCSGRIFRTTGLGAESRVPHQPAERQERPCPDDDGSAPGACRPLSFGWSCDARRSRGNSPWPIRRRGTRERRNSFAQGQNRTGGIANAERRGRLSKPLGDVIDLIHLWRSFGTTAPIRGVPARRRGEPPLRNGRGCRAFDAWQGSK